MPYPHYQAMAKAKREKEKRHAEEVLKGVGMEGNRFEVKVEGMGGFTGFFLLGEGGQTVPFTSSITCILENSLEYPLARASCLSSL